MSYYVDPCEEGKDRRLFAYLEEEQRQREEVAEVELAKLMEQDRMWKARRKSEEEKYDLRANAYARATTAPCKQDLINGVPAFLMRGGKV